MKVKFCVESREKRIEVESRISNLETLCATEKVGKLAKTITLSHSNLLIFTHNCKSISTIARSLPLALQLDSWPGKLPCQVLLAAKLFNFQMSNRMFIAFTMVLRS